MAKLTFSDALECVNDGRHVNRAEVRADALRRVIWIAEWHLPGCLSESHSVCLTKDEAIETACAMAETESGIPRGMKTALRKSGRFDSQSPIYGTCVNTVSRATLADIL